MTSHATQFWANHKSCYMKNTLTVIYALGATHEENAIWVSCCSNVASATDPAEFNVVCRPKHNLPNQIDSNAALLPYLTHQLGLAREWSGIWNGLIIKFQLDLPLASVIPVILNEINCLILCEYQHVDRFTCSSHSNLRATQITFLCCFERRHATLWCDTMCKNWTVVLLLLVCFDYSSVGNSGPLWMNHDLF